MKSGEKDISGQTISQSQRYEIVILCNLAERFDTATGAKTRRDAEMMKVVNDHSRAKLAERILDEASSQQCGGADRQTQRELTERAAAMMIALTPPSEDDPDASMPEAQRQAARSGLAEAAAAAARSASREGRAQRWWHDTKWLLSTVAGDAVGRRG